MASRIRAGIGAAVLSLFKFVLPAILALGAVAAPAQPDSLVGQWRGVYQGITITIVIQPNGQYSQLAQAATMMTQQSGPYKLVAPNTSVFSVTNWAPKTQQIYHAIGTAGGYYMTQPAGKPPGSSDTYVFNGPYTMTLSDQTMHGSITLTRVR